MSDWEKDGTLEEMEDEEHIEEPVDSHIRQSTSPPRCSNSILTTHCSLADSAVQSQKPLSHETENADQIRVESGFNPVNTFHMHKVTSDKKVGRIWIKYGRLWGYMARR